MASLRKEVVIDASADAVWDAVRDHGQAHRRLVPGMLTDTRSEPGARVVTFANGLVLRELIVSVDDAQRRFAYAAAGGRTSHHHASIQVLTEGEGRCRVLWVTDFLPDELAPTIGALMDAGAQDMKRTLELRADAQASAPR